MDTWTHPECLKKIKRQALRDIPSSCATWQNLSALSLLERTRLNLNNSHLDISSAPLIDDEETHQMVTPNFAYI